MISVVIPVYNGAAYIGQAIESALDQTLPPGEILVVDDGSTDSTAAVVRRYPAPVRHIPQAHRGSATARNLGVREAQGDLLALLDADDEWLPEKLALQAAALREDPRLDLVFGQMVEFRSPELPPEQVATLACDETPQRSALPSCLLAPRSSFERVGLFSEGWKADFIDWYLRAQEARLAVRFLDTVLVKRRIHPGNISLTAQGDVKREYLQLLKLSLNRRRANSAAGEANPVA
jgi:glycosyltransferase involved in cell wall biosynthesis